MSKKNGKPGQRLRLKPKLRRKPPRIEHTKGDTQILCPYCPDAHPIFVNKTSGCGTKLELVAVQEVYTGKKVRCVLCGQTGGTLMRVGDLYRHTHECTPGRTLMTAGAVAASMASWIASYGCAAVPSWAGSPALSSSTYMQPGTWASWGRCPDRARPS